MLVSFSGRQTCWTGPALFFLLPGSAAIDNFSGTLSGLEDSCSWTLRLWKPHVMKYSLPICGFLVKAIYHIPGKASISEGKMWAWKGTEDKNRARGRLGSVEEPVCFATVLSAGSQKNINRHYGWYRHIVRAETLKYDFSEKSEFACLCCLFRGGLGYLLRHSLCSWFWP